MLYIIGTGLNSLLDIPHSAIPLLKSCKHIYLETYTSRSLCNKSELEALLGKSIDYANRDLVEGDNNAIINKLKEGFSIGLLIVGTPLFATTHLDIMQRTREAGHQVKIMHNASIMNSMGAVGLNPYRFGMVVSIPKFNTEMQYPPLSVYDYLKRNMSNGLHTLVLLDIQADKNYFMSPSEAVERLLILESKSKYNLLNIDSKIFVISRFGMESEKIEFLPLKKILSKNFGEPLHSLIVPAALDSIELEFLNKFY